MARWGAASIVWRKVLDFKSLKDDSGLYVHDATFAFVEDAGKQVFVSSPPLLTAGTRSR